MGKSLVLLLILVFFTAFCYVTPLSVNSTPKMIVVPDDYATIADAIGNAADGDTIVVKEGSYEEETLVIDKALSLIGENASNTVINLHPPYNETRVATQVFYDYGDAISINANGVELSNLTIAVTRGGDISVNGNRTRIMGNNIEITDIDTGLHLKSFFNVIVGNSVWSIFLDNAYSNTISNNTCGYLRLGYANQTSAYNIISGNKIKARTRSLYGILIGSSSHNVFYNNYIANCQSTLGGGNGVAIGGEPSENNTFYHNTFIQNNEHVGIYNGAVLGTNFWDNRVEGNCWDDYNGTDNNGDGIGDAPYVIDGNNIDYYPLMEPYDVENDAVVLPAANPFPAIIGIAVAVSVIAIAAVFIVYFRKRNHQ